LRHYLSKERRLIDRRDVLLGGGAIWLAGYWQQSASATAQPAIPKLVVSVAEFGARNNSRQDNTQAIQAAIGAVERRGGGTVLIPGRYRCGNVIVSGHNIRLQGQDGWLVDGRLTVAPAANDIEVLDLGLVDTTGNRQTYLMDISGRNCRFTNLQLVKDPPAGGLHMYLRERSFGCHFVGLKLRGSNGTMVMGRQHLFEDFDLEARLLRGGGDDAFAIKAIGSTTESIIIKNGIVRGYGAIVSFGSEIGARKGIGQPGIVRNVTVENVTGDRCTRIAFFKPGAFDYDFRDGVVEQITLRNLVLKDLHGQDFRTGIYLLAGRGAIIRHVRASGIEIDARAVDQGFAPTSAVNVVLLDKGRPAAIEDVNVEVRFTDPFAGARHSPTAPGFPVDQIARIEKRNPCSGIMSGIVLNVEGRGSSGGGVFISEGLDGAVSIPHAILTRVATDPRGAGGAGIWSDSSVRVGDVTINSVRRPAYGGSAFSTSHHDFASEEGNQLCP
jgi:hypothetical protein